MKVIDVAKSLSPLRNSQKVELQKIRKEHRDYFITPSWDFDPFGPLSTEEKSHLRGLQNQEKDRLRRVADARHTMDPRKRQTMMAPEDEIVTHELMKKKTFHNLVKKNMHDFTRRIRESLLKERLEKFQRMKDAEKAAESMDTHPSTPKMSAEKEVRNKFMNFMKNVVTTKPCQAKMNAIRNTGQTRGPMPELSDNESEEF